MPRLRVPLHLLHQSGDLRGTSRSPGAAGIHAGCLADAVHGAVVVAELGHQVQSLGELLQQLLVDGDTQALKVAPDIFHHLSVVLVDAADSLLPERHLILHLTADGLDLLVYGLTVGVRLFVQGVNGGVCGVVRLVVCQLLLLLGQLLLQGLALRLGLPGVVQLELGDPLLELGDLLDPLRHLPLVVRLIVGVLQQALLQLNKLLVGVFLLLQLLDLFLIGAAETLHGGIQ